MLRLQSNAVRMNADDQLTRPAMNEHQHGYMHIK